MKSTSTPAGLRAVFHIFFRGGHGRQYWVLFLLVLGGLAESIGLASMLPVVAIATGEVGRAKPSMLDQIVRDAFATFGATPDLATLCIAMVAGTAVKGVIVLYAMNQVGYAVAEVATDLRRILIERLLADEVALVTRLAGSGDDEEPAVRPLDPDRLLILDEEPGSGGGCGLWGH